jgi:hypothetical protein
VQVRLESHFVAISNGACDSVQARRSHKQNRHSLCSTLMPALSNPAWHMSLTPPSQAECLAESERTPSKSDDNSVNQTHELSNCTCLTCCWGRAGNIQAYVVLNRRLEETPTCTVERVVYVVFCVGRAVVVGLGALLTVGMTATFVH